METTQNKSQNLTIYVWKIRGTIICLERVQNNSNELIKSIWCKSRSKIKKAELMDWND